MFYLDHSADGAYDPAAAPLFGAVAGFGIPSHVPNASWDTSDPSWDNWAKPPVNESGDCYCGFWPDVHPAGREGHGSHYVPTPEGSAQAAYDRYDNGSNVVPSMIAAG